MNLELRRLEQRDLETVEVIERASYPTPWSRSMFAAELRKPSALALGAYLDTGELVGYAFVSRYVDAWHVMNVAVAPEFRRRGIATALLARLFDITADDRRRGYTLEVRVSNTDAIQLYEQLGFEARGIRPRAVEAARAVRPRARGLGPDRRRCDGAGGPLKPSGVLLVDLRPSDATRDGQSMPIRAGKWRRRADSNR